MPSRRAEINDFQRRHSPPRRPADLGMVDVTTRRAPFTSLSAIRILNNVWYEAGTAHALERPAGPLYPPGLP